MNGERSRRRDGETRRGGRSWLWTIRVITNRGRDMDSTCGVISDGTAVIR
jgi:hypothetical protein